MHRQKEHLLPTKYVLMKWYIFTPKPPLKLSELQTYAKKEVVSFLNQNPTHTVLFDKTNLYPTSEKGNTEQSAWEETHLILLISRR